MTTVGSSSKSFVAKKSLHGSIGRISDDLAVAAMQPLMGRTNTIGGVGVPDRDEYVREFQRARADFVSAQIAFTNAVIAARKVGISDEELAAVSVMKESEISEIPATH